MKPQESRTEESSVSDRSDSTATSLDVEYKIAAQIAAIFWSLSPLLRDTGGRPEHIILVIHFRTRIITYYTLPATICCSTYFIKITHRGFLTFSLKMGHSFMSSLIYQGNQIVLISDILLVLLLDKMCGWKETHHNS